jgi:hypothetical protein
MTGFREIISLSLEKLEKKKEQAIKRKELAEYIIILFCEKLENAKRAKTYLDELN